jgi:ABC-2 type transport system ATP-binding protein
MRPTEPTDPWGVRDLTVRYGRLTAVDGVTVELMPGTVTGIVGGDGAGKTTVLRALVGAVRPSAGTVSAPDRRRLGYVSAGPGIYRDLSVDANLAFAARAYGVPGPAFRERSAELLARTELTAARARSAGQLSGGMRQKLALACALLHRPELLVLDEPTTGVDPVSRAELWQLLTSAAAGGAAILLSTTYLDEAERAGAVVVLDAGRQLATGTPADVVASTPGRIVQSTSHPTWAGARTWRRGPAWRAWSVDGTAPPGSAAAPPRLEDAVIVAALAREAGAPASAGDLRDPLTVSPEAPAAPGGGARQRRSLPPAVEALGATKRFGRVTAVDRVSLAVWPGEVVGLIGANGAGKTTLVRMLLGLLRPSAGAVRLFGSPPSLAARRRLGYVPQALGLYDDLTVRENLAFSAAAFGHQPPAAPVPDLDRLVGQTSLGVQRQAAFAAALAHEPELLVLDEPTSGVGPLARSRLWDTIRMAAEAGVAVLVTTHHTDEAEQCDRLVVMSAGQVGAEGAASSIAGADKALEVRARDWQAAFAALDAGGLRLTLAGTVLRLPASDASRTRQLLAEHGVSAELALVPATLEEVFVRLAGQASAAPRPQAASSPA